MTIGLGNHDITARIADGQDRHHKGSWQNTSRIMEINYLIYLHLHK